MYGSDQLFPRLRSRSRGPGSRDSGDWGPDAGRLGLKSLVVATSIPSQRSILVPPRPDAPQRVDQGDWCCQFRLPSVGGASCEAAIARPDRPSARNCNTSFALIFRTIEILLPPCALYARREEPTNPRRPPSTPLPAPTPTNQTSPQWPPTTRSLDPSDADIQPLQADVRGRSLSLSGSGR